MRVSRWIVSLIMLVTYVRVVHGYALHIGDTILVPRATCDTEHKLWFQIGNETMCLPMTENFVPNTLHVEHNGITYSAGQLELFYEASVFNSCQSVSLPRGVYCVELLGGHGGDGGNNPGSGLASEDAKYECFEVSKTTTVSVFRGGDGNNGSVNSNGNVRSGGGGGASGVPSLFAMGNTVFVSGGGAGGTGGGARDYSGDNINCGGGGGGGGNASSGGNGLNGSVNAALSNDFIVCGGGGGGAVSGTGGTSATGNALIFLTYTADAGSNARANAGGAGGAAHRPTSQKAGGNGGNNTTYTCAGTSLVSYGGGGGGGVCTRFSSSVDLNGGAGGSGSTGTSSTSYVRIYRFE